MTCRYRRFAWWATFILAPQISGCATWSVIAPNPEEYVNAHNPDEVRVTEVDNSSLVLRAPQVRADSIIGVTGGGLKKDDPLRTVGVPLERVKTMEVRRSNTGGALALVGIAMLIGAAIFEANGGVMGD